MKKNYTYLSIFIVISIFTFLFIYFINTQEDNNKSVDGPYTLKVLEKDSSWIYEIYNHENLFIRQEYIPSVKGKQNFKSKEDAEKIGNLVVSKLSKNTFPVINKSDLSDYNINFDTIN